MTPQELKNSILQLAIKGKLVAQRPEEGTAAELLEKIAGNGITGTNGTDRTHRTAGTAEATKAGLRAAHRASSVPSVPVVPPIPDDDVEDGNLPKDEEIWYNRRRFFMKERQR